MFFIIFIAEEIGGMGEKGSGDNTVIDVQIYSDVFLNMTPRSVCFNNEAFFLVKSRTSVLGTTLKCHTITISD